MRTSIPNVRTGKVIAESSRFVEPQSPCGMRENICLLSGVKEWMTVSATPDIGLCVVIGQALLRAAYPDYNSIRRVVYKAFTINR
jgi:hypothetical protein